MLYWGNIDCIFYFEWETFILIQSLGSFKKLHICGFWCSDVDDMMAAHWVLLLCHMVWGISLVLTHMTLEAT